MPWDMTQLDPPTPSAALNAREQLELFIAQAQFRLSMVALGIYFLVLIVFLGVLQFVGKDNQLTLAVLLLQPLSILIGSLGAFWLQRARGNTATDAGATQVTTSSTPQGQTTTTIAPAPPIMPSAAPPPNSPASG